MTILQTQTRVSANGNHEILFEYDRKKSISTFSVRPAIAVLLGCCLGRGVESSSLWRNQTGQTRMILRRGYRNFKHKLGDETTAMNQNGLPHYDIHAAVVDARCR